MALDLDRLAGSLGTSGQSSLLFERLTAISEKFGDRSHFGIRRRRSREPKTLTCIQYYYVTVSFLTEVRPTQSLVPFFICNWSVYQVGMPYLTTTHLDRLSNSIYRLSVYDLQEWRKLYQASTICRSISARKVRTSSYSIWKKMITYVATLCVCLYEPLSSLFKNRVSSAAPR